MVKLSRPRPVPAASLSTVKMACGNEKLYPKVIDNGVLKDWVGIGWVELRRATKADYEKYPEVAR